MVHLEVRGMFDDGEELFLKGPLAAPAANQLATGRHLIAAPPLGFKGRGSNCWDLQVYTRPIPSPSPMLRIATPYFSCREGLALRESKYPKSG